MASSDDYRQTLAAALRYAEIPADPSTSINVLSGEVAIFSAACDGTGDHSMKLLLAQAGQPPAEHGPPSPEADTGLLVTARSTKYRVNARSYTELEDSSCFARWLLIPEQPGT